MNKLKFLMAGSAVAMLAGTVSAVQAFPSSVADADCGGQLDSLRIVRTQQIKAVTADTKVNVVGICQGEELDSFGNAAGLTHTIAANPPLVAALKNAGYRPDDVVGVMIGDSGFVLLYVHQEAHPHTSVIQNLSDRRLKTDIHFIETLASGIRLYSFRYIGGSEIFTGVMAQDLLADPRYSAAVRQLPSGYYVVDYDAIGLSRLVTKAMRVEGERALEQAARQAA